MKTSRSNVRMLLYTLGASVICLSSILGVWLSLHGTPWPTTHWTTGLCVVFLVFAQWDASRTIRWLMAALVLVLGATLYTVLDITDPMNRMSWMTSASLLFLILGYCASGVGKVSISRRFWLATITFPLFALLGYALGNPRFYDAMAPLTALGLLCMGYAGLMAPMQVSGPMNTLFKMALRASGIAVLVPIMLVLFIHYQNSLDQIASVLAVLITAVSLILHYAALRWAERFQWQAWRAQRERGQLIEQVNRDELTQIFNRRHFLQLATPLVESADRYRHAMSALFIDVDHFKHINDNHSHVQGDAALVWLAGALSKHLRASDVLARFGGEEFVVLLPNTSLKAAMLSAEKLRTEVAKNSSSSGVDEGFTVSIGCVTRQHGEALAALIRRADEACYQAKKRGRNCVVSQPYLASDLSPETELS